MESAWFREIYWWLGFVFCLEVDLALAIVIALLASKLWWEVR